MISDPQKKNRVKVFNATFNNISVILWQLNIGILLKSYSLIWSTEGLFLQSLFAFDSVAEVFTLYRQEFCFSNLSVIFSNLMVKANKHRE